MDVMFLYLWREKGTFQITTIFRLPDHIGNVATWTETQWELNKVKEIQMNLPMLCNATEIGPITFPEKMSFSALTHLCKSFGSNVIVIENNTSLLQALELTENINCKYEYIFWFIIHQCSVHLIFEEF